MGLHADILKHQGRDYSAGGISSRADDVCIVNVDGPFDPDNRHPAVMLIRGPGGGGHVIAVPAVADGNGGWVEEQSSSASRMCGGTFIHTSDSRFGDAVKMLGGVRGTAVSFHDRFERGR